MRERVVPPRSLLWPKCNLHPRVQPWKPTYACIMGRFSRDATSAAPKRVADGEAKGSAESKIPKASELELVEIEQGPRPASGQRKLLETAPVVITIYDAGAAVQGL